MSEKKKLIVSFSGGRTSAYMMWWLYNEWQERNEWEMITVFANTGKEVECTLFFVDECSQEWNIPIVWVEAKCKDENGIPFSEKGWSVRHKIVTYETASRKGEPFEEMISVLGIPSTEAPFCSKQLKRMAIESYANSIGWDNYMVSIGIRLDETDKRSLDLKRCIYPFVFDNPVNKLLVNVWWLKQSFNLDIDPDLGNCDVCWKKDDPRLARISIKYPKKLDWWQNMEDKYKMLKPRDNETNPPYYFFRGQRSVLDIRKLGEISQSELKQLSMFEPIDPCNESCEVF